MIDRTYSGKVVAMIIAYNCASMLERALSRIPRELVDEIFVMDDCSSDNTSQVAEKLGLKVFRNHKNLGYGGNVKAGLRNALDLGADYVVEVHGDGAQFNPIAICQAQPYMQNSVDLILGSRFIQRRKALANGMPLIRFIANQFLSFFDRLVLKLSLTEFHTGFRIYSRTLIEQIPVNATSDDYLYSFQIIAQAAYYGLSVREVEVEADYINEHTSHKLSGAALYALQTFKILFDFSLARLHISYHPLFPKLGI